MNRSDRPKQLVIMGKPYTITYCKSPSEVDSQHRMSLWGQHDAWAREIRVFDDGTTADEDVWHTLFHEVLHAIGEILKLHMLEDEDNHEALDLLALALADLTFHNGLLPPVTKKE